MAQAASGQFQPAFSPHQLLMRRAILPVIAVFALSLAIWVHDKSATLGFLTVALIAFAAWLFCVFNDLRQNAYEMRQVSLAKSLCELDQRATFLSDFEGDVLWQNSAALAHFVQVSDGFLSISRALDGSLPNAGAVVRRLSTLAIRQGNASERLFGLSNPIDIQVQRVAHCLLWRIESKPDSEQDVASAMLTVGRKGTILFMNTAARELIGERVTSLDRLFVPNASSTGALQTLATKRGPSQVRVRKQALQRDRFHLFLTPVAAHIEHGEFALGDLPVPLLHLNQSGIVEQANEAALALLGRCDLQGLSMAAIFEGFGLSLEDWLAKTKALAQAVDAEFLRVRDQKKETFVQVVLKRMGSGDDAKIVALLSDATKLKSLEAQFVQSQKMQAIGQLAGGVAHDFNNLLTAISGHCDLMLLRHDPGDQDYADLMQVHQNANRAAGLVSQLLAFSRKQTLQLEQMDIRNTLSDLTHLLNRLVGETVTLTLSHDPVLKPVRADKRQLEQVIMNLVVNARDAMPNGGEIMIETESMTLSAPMRRERVVVPNGDYVVVRVRDVGIGIEPDALQKIFEPFYTTKRTGEGTGLGLSTAYGIVKQTGGYIFADSEPGQGTCFSLLFPASEEREEKPEKPAEPRQPRLSSQCSGVVLLVEDEAPVRAFASRALSMRGFEVVEAESAEQALDLLKDDALEVDVFVTDVVMPGMDGPTWVREALKNRPNVNVIFVSGYAEGAFQGGNSPVPNSVFLPKPFSLTELTTTVQSQMN
ncbi:MAG: ATP-binding protein [Planktotalea sp.]|uniref:hybrid sensor histidine kinase/response regulator n=1 Tax=Planktotalea sp. TaxID=2029877 RepID=UPI003C761F12